LDIFTNNSSPYVGTTAVGSPPGNDQGMVQFNVSSTVYGDMGAATSHVLHLISANNGTVVNFLGSVYSTTMNVGVATVNFDGGPTATNTVAVNFSGDGTIALSPNTTATGALSTSTDNTGTLSLGGGSQLTGAVGAGAFQLKAINVTGGNNTAGVSAGIIGAIGTHSFSLLTNTLNISGAMTLSSNGTISTTLGSPTVYGHIIPAGATNLGTGLQVKVVVPSTALIPVGAKFNIIQPQAAGTSGVAVTVTDPTNPLYTFSAAPTANGQVQINTTSIPLQAPSQPLPIAPILPPLLPIVPVTTDLGTVLAAINALTDPVAVTHAEAQLQPSAASLAAPQVVFQGGSGISESLVVSSGYV